MCRGTSLRRGALAHLVLTLRPAVAVSAATAWNFAFGANLDAGTRERRALGPRSIVPGVVRGWELVFSLSGVPFLEPGFAAVRPSPAGAGGRQTCVHGACLELDRGGWLRLLASEGVLDGAAVARVEARQEPLEAILRAASQLRPRAGYRLAEVAVEAYPGAEGPRGAPRAAYALTDSPAGGGPGAAGGAAVDRGPGAVLEEHGVPSERYWRLLRNGARAHRLDPDYRAFLRSFPRFTPTPLAGGALLLALPALLAGAAAARPAAVRTQREWPAGVPLARAAGRVNLGPEIPSATWSRFCSVPREALVERLRRLLGEDVPFASFS